MENHDPTTSTPLPFSDNFLVQSHEEKTSSTLPMFDSILHTNVMYNQPTQNNPKRKRSRFLRITSPTSCSSSSGGVGGGVGKAKITKKPPDPSAPKITRPCSECGKKFWSWKALFGHMRCHPERQWRGINPPPNIRPLPRQQQHMNNVFDDDSEKNIKLVSDTMIMTDEDHEVAACLLQLANGSSKHDDETLNNEDQPPDDENENDVVKDMRNVAVASDDNQPCSSSGGGGIKDNRFECSGCKKVFGSHQALGGHRASHKNVKGCYASASGSGSGLTQATATAAAVVVTPMNAHNNNEDNIPNLDLNFPPPVKLISVEDQYDSSSSYSSTYSVSGLDLRLKL